MMSNHGTQQIEEYRHRIQYEIFNLNKVNAEVVYFLDKYGYLEKIFSGVKNYRERLFRTLASTEHNRRLAYGQQLMQDLWEIELCLGVYPFSDVLSEFEFGGQFYHGYRDHVLHQLRVYLLGLYFFFGCKKIQRLFQNFKFSDFLLQWKIASLAHDHGYLFEVLESERNQWVLNKVMPVFDHCIAFTFSGLSEAVRNDRFAETDDLNRNHLIELLRKRGITHNREHEIKRSLEIIDVSPRTIKDIRVFREINLFIYLAWASDLTRLSVEGKNGFEAYYDFAASHRPDQHRERFRDHGITSALFLLLQSEYNNYYANKILGGDDANLKKMGLPSENIEFIKGLTPLIFNAKNSIKIAASAVALHNIHKGIFQEDQLTLIAEREYGLTLNDFSIPHMAFPLAFLLVLVDTLQDWDRPSFIPLALQDLPLHQSDQDLSITLDNEHINLAFPSRDKFSFNPFQKMKDQLKVSLDPVFIDDLLRETSWKALGICFLTPDAQRIVSACASPSSLIPTTKLKELLSLGRKYNHFECALFIDTHEEIQFLRLIRDLVAMANTNDGYFIVGIDEKNFEPFGIDAKTYIHESDTLCDLINAFCSSPITVHYHKQKVLIKTADKREYRWFFIFFVPKSPTLIAFVKDGRGKEGTSNLFLKNDIPIRQDSQTVMADRDSILDRFRDAKIDNDIQMANSILALQRLGKIPQEYVHEKPLPGNLPIPDFDRLIGRDTEIKDLIKFLDNSKRFILTIDGLGGSGKSALALEVARNIKNRTYNAEGTPYKLRTQFDVVIWVTAKTCELTAEGIMPMFSSTVTLDILLDQIAEAIEFPELKSRDFEDKKTSIIECLEAFNCLIIIDNLETISDAHKEEIITFVEEEIPQLSKVIYTTRTKFHEGYSMRVLELEPHDAVALARDIAIQIGNYKLANDNQVINQVLQRTGRIPLGIRWVISRISLGYTAIEAIEKVMDDRALVRFCFEETFKYLGQKERRILFAIAVCHFVPTKDNLEFLTGFSRKELELGLERLESFSLVKIQGSSIHILPLTKDYSLYQLDQIPDLANELSSRIHNLCTLDETVGESLPVALKMARKLFKEAVFEDTMGNALSAVDKLGKALNLSREDYILKGLAEIKERMGKQESALKLYEEYLNKKSDDLEILIKMANYSRKEGDSMKALKYISTANTLDPSAKDLWYHRGRIEMDLSQQYEKNTPSSNKYCKAAIESFQKAIRKPATTVIEQNFNSTNYLNIALCHFRLFEPAQAYDACCNGLEENPDNFKLASFKKKVQTYL